MEHQVEVYADHYQFYVRDELADIGDGIAAVEIAIETMQDQPRSHERTGSYGGSLVILTPDRDSLMTPVTVAILDSPAPYEPADWDAIEEGFIQVMGDRLVVDMLPDPNQPRVPIIPGPYAYRVFIAGLAAVYAGTPDATERYRVELWPSQPIPRRVVKVYEISSAANG